MTQRPTIHEGKTFECRDGVFQVRNGQRHWLTAEQVLLDRLRKDREQDLRQQ